MATSSSMSGFPEWLPEMELIQQKLIETVRHQYQLHGFAPLQTRSIELISDLLSKGEDADKEIYALRRISEEPGNDSESLGLHYDLTIPFARFVSQNRGKLTFPFRRYQIQQAWRGERPQLGRYREFIQADADVIGMNTLPVRYDGDLIRILRDTLVAMALPPIKVMVNNRKILEGFYRGLGIEDITSTLRTVDKLNKIGADGVRKVLSERGLSEQQVDGALAIAQIECDADGLEQVRSLGVSHELLAVGLDELETVLRAAPSVGNVEVVGAMHIARGFDYYTGTVVEGILADHPQLGSICSGGRYDNLASDAKVKLPGVGVSIGITRIMGYAEHLGLFSPTRRTPAVACILVDNEDTRADSDAIADRLRARGIPCLVSDKARAYGKQIKAANNLGIRYVWFPSSGEVKDIVTGEQAPADADTWQPAAETGSWKD